MSFKASLKQMIGRTLSIDFLEKLTEYSIAARDPRVSLRSAESIVPPGQGWTELIDSGRVTLWQKTLGRLPSSDILLLEFGVWKGDSLREFLKLNSSPRSQFYGFDSFEGLPEDWRGMAAERFDVEGAPPKIDDPRLEFVKGWFRDTVPPMLERLAEAAQERSVLVHFDADLYSSTLYLLFALGSRLKRYHFIFDEFSGHECRALYNYLQATGAEARFLYRLDWQGSPQVVAGELIVS